MKVKQKSVQGRERHQENKIKTKQSRAEQSSPERRKISRGNETWRLNRPAGCAGQLPCSDSLTTGSDFGVTRLASAATSTWTQLVQLAAEHDYVHLP